MFTRISCILFFCLPLLASRVAVSQEPFNQTDRDGKKEGLWKKTDSAGNLVYTGRFSGGVPVDTFRYYYPGGNMKALSVFSEQGQRVQSVSYFRNGRIMARGQYFHEKKDGPWHFFSEYDTNKVSEEHYSDGMKDGPATIFFPDGKVSETMIWKKDVRDGPWNTYYTDGILKMKGNYLNGEKSGAFTFFFPSGKMMISGEYLQGHQHGIWKYFDETGTVMKTETYDRGILLDRTPKEDPSHPD